MQLIRTPAAATLLKKQEQAGLTLIEVLITLIVVSVGLLGLAALQAIGLQQNHSAYVRTQATNIAHEIMDELRSNRSQLAPGGNVPNRAFWDQRVATLLPGGVIQQLDIAADGGVLSVQLVLEWVDERVEPDPDDPNAPDGRIQFATESLI